MACCVRERVFMRLVLSKAFPIFHFISKIFFICVVEIDNGHIQICYVFTDFSEDEYALNVRLLTFTQMDEYKILLAGQSANRPNHIDLFLFSLWQNRMCDIFLFACPFFVNIYRRQSSIRILFGLLSS